MPGSLKIFIGFAFVENVPSSKVQKYSRMIPSGSLASAVKLTVNGTAPEAGLADGAQRGAWPTMVLRRNHGVAVTSVLKNASSCEITLALPFVDGWVKSDVTSEQSHMKP